MKHRITEEMKVHEKWFEEAKKQTVNTLPEFVRHLVEDYEHDFGTICHAIAAAGLAGMYAIENSPEGGITGYQAGFCMWGIVKNWSYENNKCGLRMLNYDDLLYPQYEYKFNSISRESLEAVINEAKNRLKEYDRMRVHPDVISHWESIVNGEVPFGLKVEDD